MPVSLGCKKTVLLFSHNHRKQSLAPLPYHCQVTSLPLYVFFQLSDSHSSRRRGQDALQDPVNCQFPVLILDGTLQELGITLSLDTSFFQFLQLSNHKNPQYLA